MSGRFFALVHNSNNHFGQSDSIACVCVCVCAPYALTTCSGRLWLNGRQQRIFVSQMKRKVRHDRSEIRWIDCGGTEQQNTHKQKKRHAKERFWECCSNIFFFSHISSVCTSSSAFDRWAADSTNRRTVSGIQLIIHVFKWFWTSKYNYMRRLPLDAHS